MRVVVADDVEANLVELVIDAQLIARIHVVVHWLSASLGDAAASIAKHALLGADVVRGIANGKHALHLAIASAKDAAYLIGGTCLRLFDKVLPQGLGKDEAVNHQQVV